MNEIKVPISPGELLDKITILRIKSQRMTDPGKLANVRVELDALEETWKSSRYAAIDVETDLNALFAVNGRLWTIDEDFVRLARAVYIENDERAAIKRRLNVKLGSSLVEEKSYSQYRS